MGHQLASSSGRKKVVVLGSTGSIGKQTLDIIGRFQDKFEVTGLSAHRNVDELLKQASAFNVKNIAVVHPGTGANFSGTTVFKGEDSALRLLESVDYDMAVNAIVGAAGLKSSIKILKAGKTLGLANKESMVAGGKIIRSLLNGTNKIIPIDSEHSAVFQCLEHEDHRTIDRIILTASGGPFRGKTKKELKDITAEQALKHPNWEMGAKITIDSATLMNKGLEVIEAHFLFDIPYDRIEVLVHPQSVIHGMAVFGDGTSKAIAGKPDMRIPIGYALNYPERFNFDNGDFDIGFDAVGTLEFGKPDLDTFECLKYAFDAAKEGKTYPTVLSAANEVAVENFLRGKISFLGIADIVGKTLESHKPADDSELAQVLASDSWAREFAKQLIERQ